MIPEHILTAISDEDWPTIFDKNGTIKPLSEIPKHIAELPGFKDIYK